MRRSKNGQLERSKSVSREREMLVLMFDCILHFTSVIYQLSLVRGFIDTCYIDDLLPQVSFKNYKREKSVRDATVS